MKNTLITILISVGLLGALIWMAWPRHEMDMEVVSGESLLAAAAPFHDFGKTSMAQGEVTHEFELTNDSSHEVMLGKIFTSCMCTSAVLSVENETFGPYGMRGHGFIPRVNRTMAPGASAILRVTFDPAAHGPAGVGMVERSITVEQDGAPPLTVSFSAEVTP